MYFTAGQGRGQRCLAIQQPAEHISGQVTPAQAHAAAVPAARLLLPWDQKMSELGPWAELADRGVASTAGGGNAELWTMTSLFSGSLQLNDCIVISVL